MKKIFMLMLAGALAALPGSGCIVARVRHSAPEEGQKSRAGHEVMANIRAENTSFLLFNCLPICTGNAWQPNRNDLHWFTSELRDKHFKTMFAAYNRDLRSDGFEDVRYSENSTGIFTLFLVWRKTRIANCVAVTLPKSKNKDEK